MGSVAGVVSIPAMDVSSATTVVPLGRYAMRNAKQIFVRFAGVDWHQWADHFCLEQEVIASILIRCATYSPVSFLGVTGIRTKEMRKNERRV